MKISQILPFYINEGLIKVNDQLLNDMYQKAVLYYAAGVARHVLPSMKEHFRELVAEMIRVVGQYGYSETDLKKAVEQLATSRSNIDITIPLEKYGLQYSYKKFKSNQITLIINPVRINVPYGEFMYEIGNLVLYLMPTINSFEPDLLAGKSFKLVQDSLKTLLWHELTHFTQYFHAWHPSQLQSGEPSKNKRIADKNYFMSNIEFDPNIKTVIGLISQLKHKFRGPKLKAAVMHLLDLPQSEYQFGFKKSELFTTLKKYDYDRYKKALKYLFSNVDLE